jgi:hypothetical protein
VWALGVVAWVGCAGPGGETGETGATLTGACALAEANTACPECSDGLTTCTFRDTSETANSCGGCQARSALYATLCAAGEEATEAEILDELTCSVVGS